MLKDTYVSFLDVILWEIKLFNFHQSQVPVITRLDTFVTSFDGSFLLFYS